MKPLLFIFSIFTTVSAFAGNKIIQSSSFETNKHGKLTMVVIHKPLVDGHKIWSESDRNGMCKAVLNEPELQEQLRGLTFIGSTEYDRTEYWFTYTNALSLKNFVEIDQNGMVVGEIPSSHRYIKKMNCYLKNL